MIEIKAGKFKDLDNLLRQLDGILGTTDTMEFIAQLVEGQIKDRISKEKTAPNGTRWQQWSKRYARTRKPEHSLLIDTGDLLKSIHNGVINTAEAFVATDSVYGAVHQFGNPKKNIPARPFFGLSEDNKNDVEAELTEWIKQRLKRT
ncbi:phage virion morphogenesis protein [Beggiatoa leptomitoformis]|uniref:Phage virion morphogenesis protein n=1 Tax=Beggiatoa leptomitoformis TaxID=288004 RepID=A0A2N9YH45_9GAMM|nr:phage virion morphogenesis protein [Beggiatoa leptomitoformis]ALG69420.2 phage virion morphogenesis protein [Beggiatoa leptomitoformis]AUI69852.1 phage virion morphogenesis protein [Beggiatoa leptomitoformis]